MKTGYGKILGVIISISVVLLIFWLSLSLEDKNKPEIELIELNGNYHLDKEEYFTFAHLDNTDDYKFLTLSVIKDRLEKHPYLESVDVKLENKNKVTINLTEKDFSTVLLHNNSSYILTESFEVLPYLQQTKKVDFPLISNLEDNFEIKEFTSLADVKSLINAYKILFAIKLVNPGLYDQLSDLDMGKGKNIILTFTNFDYPVLLGQKNLVRKIVYFDSLYDIVAKYKNSSLLEYIDLRYNKKVYLGVNTEYNRGLNS